MRLDINQQIDRMQNFVNSALPNKFKKDWHVFLPNDEDGEKWAGTQLKWYEVDISIGFNPIDHITSFTAMLDKGYTSPPECFHFVAKDEDDLSCHSKAFKEFLGGLI